MLRFATNILVSQHTQKNARHGSMRDANEGSENYSRTVFRAFQAGTVLAARIAVVSHSTTRRCIRQHRPRRAPIGPARGKAPLPELNGVRASGHASSPRLPRSRPDSNQTPRRFPGAFQTPDFASGPPRGLLSLIPCRCAVTRGPCREAHRPKPRVHRPWRHLPRRPPTENAQASRNAHTSDKTHRTSDAQRERELPSPRTRRTCLLLPEEGSL